MWFLACAGEPQVEYRLSFAVVVVACGCGRVLMSPHVEYRLSFAAVLLSVVAAVC